MRHTRAEDIEGSWIKTISMTGSLCTLAFVSGMAYMASCTASSTTNISIPVQQNTLEILNSDPSLKEAFIRSQEDPINIAAQRFVTNDAINEQISTLENN